MKFDQELGNETFQEMREAYRKQANAAFEPELSFAQLYEHGLNLEDVLVDSEVEKPIVEDTVSMDDDGAFMDEDWFDACLGEGEGFDEDPFGHHGTGVDFGDDGR